VGFTSVDPWLCFSPCKNNTADAAKAQVRVPVRARRGQQAWVDNMRGPVAPAVSQEKQAGPCHRAQHRAPPHPQSRAISSSTYGRHDPSRTPLAFPFFFLRGWHAARADRRGDPRNVTPVSASFAGVLRKRGYVVGGNENTQ